MRSILEIGNSSYLCAAITHLYSIVTEISAMCCCWFCIILSPQLANAHGGRALNLLIFVFSVSSTQFLMSGYVSCMHGQCSILIFFTQSKNYFSFLLIHLFLHILDLNSSQNGFRVYNKMSTSASSKAAWISDFSCSTCFFIFSSSFIRFPPSAICSVRAEISSVREK